MTTRLHLIRHGATTLSAEDRFAGAIDVPLSDEGRAQAQRLGERLSSTKLAALYASPLSRTVETARLVGAPQGLQPQLEPGLREIAHGHWEGLRRQEVEERYRAEYESWEADPFTFAPPDGATGLAGMARA